jgi:multimeric flavodoxin WrbA
MQSLYTKIREADALVFAGPVYWFSVSAQTKLVMDRCYAFGANEYHDLAGKRVAVALSFGDADVFASGCVNALRTFQDAFRYVGLELVGMVYGSADAPGEIISNTGLLTQAEDLGKRLVT